MANYGSVYPPVKSTKKKKMKKSAKGKKPKK